MRRKKDGESAQSSHGVRISGMQLHHESGLQRWDKPTIKRSKQLTLPYMLRSFLGLRDGCSARAQTSARALLRAICEQLNALEAAVAASGAGQHCWRLFSTSLLIVYEGAAMSGCQAPSAVELVQDVKSLRVVLIDFAHSFFGEPGPDENFVAGVAALRDMLLLLSGEVARAVVE